MGVEGWRHKMSFWAFQSQVEGTIRIAVGETDAHDFTTYHCVLLNHSRYSQSVWDAGRSMSVAGWRHKQSFWAFGTPMPGTIRIAVGEDNEPLLRCMINHSDYTQQEWDSGQSMSV